MKAYIITTGAYYYAGYIVCARFKKEEAVIEAEKLVKEHNDDRIKWLEKNMKPKEEWDYLMEKRSEFKWDTSVDYVEIIETEIL